ncbi:MAG TPA: sugar phosphate isomerase/epimerase [Bryobacteraceae bacterium]|nr:sugar phosphate isomerase/epimerase [Bryobacteraceae bacterium]
MMFGDNLLHSVSYAGFWGQAALGLEAFIDKAADLGYGGVLLMAKRPHLSVLDYDAEGCARLRRKIEARGLRTVVIAGYTNFTADLEHGDIPNREMQVQHVTELARLARDLGGSMVRVFTGYENPAAGYGAQWKLVVEALRECAQRAARFGVTVGVQNHHDIAVGWETMADLIRAIAEPNCLAMFDAWAPFLHGADLREAARSMAPITCHTTIADYQLRPRYRYQPGVVNYTSETPLAQAVAMGTGAIDYGAFLAGLQEGGFRGSLAYEMCSPLADGGSMETLDRYARGFLEYMRGAAQAA